MTQTNKQVETAIDYFPDVISENTRCQDYPVHEVFFWWGTDDGNPRWKWNEKAVSFIPMLVKSGIKHEQFPEEMRGGLMIKNREGYNILKCLVCCTSNLGEKDNDDDDGPTEYLPTNEEPFLDVIQQLRKMNFLRKEDILEHDMLRTSLSYRKGPSEPNAIKDNTIFRYLVDWNHDEYEKKCRDTGNNILHNTFSLTRDGVPTPIRTSYELALEAGIRYYPTEIGFLFHKRFLIS